MKRKKLLIYLIFIAALLIIILPLVACEDYGGTVSRATAAVETTAAAVAETTADSAGVKNEVIIEGNAFRPDSITIKVGDTVTWINNDGYDHTVKARTGEFDSGNIASDAKFSFTFDKEGTYDYICGIHTFMTGKIIITK